MDRTGSYVKQRKGLVPLAPVLDKWIDLNRQYVVSWEGSDAAFGYTENTSTALFSSAAWMSGYPSICEINAGKGHKNSRNKWYGRIDIYIDAKTQWYYGEAKKSEVNCTIGTDWDSAFRSNIENASYDARQVAGAGEGSKYIALSFWALLVPERIMGNGELEAVQTSLLDYVKARPFDAAAWLLLDQPIDWGDQRYGIGVLLGIQAVEW